MTVLVELSAGDRLCQFKTRKKNKKSKKRAGDTSERRKAHKGFNVMFHFHLASKLPPLESLFADSTPPLPIDDRADCG